MSVNNVNEMQINKVYCADALEFLKKIPSESIDLIFADPPYFGNQKNSIINRYDGYSNNRFHLNKSPWAFKRKIEEQFAFAYAWLRECQRILKQGRTIWVTGTYHSIGVINVAMQDLNYKILNDIVLFKKNAPPNFTGSCFRACTENMLWAKKNGKGKLKFNYKLMKSLNNGKQMHNVWEYNAIKNKYRHPATKQETILERVILASSDEGDVILDPFCGSGTTGVVAKKLNRNWIMVDINKEYVWMSRKRLKETISS